MGRKDPEAVSFTTEGLHSDPLRHVPHTDATIFRVGHDEIVFRMEQTGRYVVGMSTQSVDLPSLCLAHPPQFHLSVVGGTGQQRESGVEGGPVHTAIVSLQNVLDHHIVCAKEFRLDVEGSSAIPSRGRSEVFHHDGLGAAHLLLPEAGGVPNPHGLIERGTDNQILTGMEGCTHDAAETPDQTRPGQSQS